MTGHGSHVGVPKQRGGYLFLRKHFLIVWLKNMLLDHVSDNTLLVGPTA